MRSLRSAASLLAAASSAEALAHVTTALGFTVPRVLDPAAADALGIPAECGAPRVARGAGALRALLIEAPPGSSLRETATFLAGRVGARAPHLDWLLALTERDGHAVVLAAWSPRLRASGDSRSQPGDARVVALAADRRRIVDSDAETLCALAAASGGGDGLTHARWLDVLGRESLTRRFYRALQHRVHELGESARGDATPAARHELALLYISRLLFLAFLEAKGWLDGDRGWLARRFDAVAGRDGFHRRVLLPLFFGTLNTPVRRRAAAARALGRIPFLNGGLFARSPIERACSGVLFPDDALGLVFGDLLGRYRFTAREDRSTWSEAAVDPEMLGKAFESLMAGEARRDSGAYYTPQALVTHMTGYALRHALVARGVSLPVASAVVAGEPVPDAERLVAARAAGALRLLDPACGSGAFLVHALERVADLRRALGDRRPVEELRRDTLTRGIFGVDVNPMAVWLCELRLWLSVVIEGTEADPLRVMPLPNLDHHVCVGDSLGGGGFDGAPGALVGRKLGVLRTRYARSRGARKRALSRVLAREERALAIDALDREIVRLRAQRLELLLAARGRDLFGARAAPASSVTAAIADVRARIRQRRDRRRALAEGAALPFSFAAHFADVAADSGFDAVIGNPPWVRLHRIPSTLRAALRRDFSVYRDAAWLRGATAASAGRGFAAQVDLAALFVERSLTLARHGGAVALLLPAKLWHSLAGGGLRRLLQSGTRMVSLEDWSESPLAFDAAVYPSVLVALRQPPDDEARLESVVQSGRERRWDMPASALPLDESPGSPWLLIPPHARAAFDRLARAGVPLMESGFGRPRLGVKCGCNGAFVVTAGEDDGATVRVRAGERHGTVDAAVLRPLIRGEDVAPWRVERTGRRLLWTHGDDGLPLASLPPGALAWLSPWRRRLAARSDRCAPNRWWSLFRTDAGRHDTHRVVWPDMARAPRAAVLPPGDLSVPLNSCYVARCEHEGDALALAAILNSPLAAAWLNVLAEPARGGYRRYLGWTVALLPLPRDWDAARAALAPVGRRAMRGDPPSAHELVDVTARCYGLTHGDVSPLLEWTSR